LPFHFQQKAWFLVEDVDDLVRGKRDKAIGFTIGAACSRAGEGDIVSAIRGCDGGLRERGLTASNNQQCDKSELEYVPHRGLSSTNFKCDATREPTAYRSFGRCWPSF
jgi:hypothetical protein